MIKKRRDQNTVKYYTSEDGGMDNEPVDVLHTMQIDLVDEYVVIRPLNKRYPPMLVLSVLVHDKPIT